MFARLGRLDRMLGVESVGRTPIISLVREKAFYGEKVLDSISPLW
jgi:hypothetical protein